LTGLFKCCTTWLINLSIFTLRELLIIDLVRPVGFEPTYHRL